MNVTLKTLRKHISDIDAGMNGNNPVFYTHSDTGIEQFAHEILRSRHTGYYTNHDGTTYRDGSGLARGVVFELPRMPGFPDGRFLAGYHWGDNDERVIYPELFNSEDDAARMADSHAECFADAQREDSARFDAMQDAEWKTEEAREACRLAVMARNVSAEHREMAREAIETLREALQDLADKTAAYERG